MRFATLISWLLTASLGAYMLRTWLARGGLHRERARPGGLPPQLIFGHAAWPSPGCSCGLAYLASGARALAWPAVVMLMVAVGLGLSTVTLWTPYPARKPGERRKPAPWDEPAVVVPGYSRRARPSRRSPAGLFEITDEMIERLFKESHSAGGDTGPFARIRRCSSPSPMASLRSAHSYSR